MKTSTTSVAMAVVVTLTNLLGSTSHAFSLFKSSSSSTVAVRSEGTSTTTKTSLQAGKKDHFDEISRRDALLGVSASLAAFTTTTVFLSPQKAAAASDSVTVVGGSLQNAKVAEWPGIENLEPMYEFKLSLDAVVAAVGDSKNWPFIQKRLDKFFKGAIFSEKSFYFGVGLQYMNDIKYMPGELPNYVLMDKQARYDALERTFQNLDALRSVLGSGGDPTAITDYAKDSQAAYASWFALVPPNDIKAVEELFLHVKKADINRNGQLSDDELAFLSPVEQELWKKRVAKFG